MRNRNATILFAFSSLILSQITQGVTPAPDGGYPGYNTAEGQNALFSRTTGVWNTALGAFALFSDTTGNGNTAVGINGLRNNVRGSFNTALGLNALYADVGDASTGLGCFNSASGADALFANTDGYSNSALGYGALSSNTTGGRNTATGAQALQSNTTGGYNTATGVQALQFNRDGGLNTATGAAALQANDHGNFNTATGGGALELNTSGSNNTAVGVAALDNNTTGGNNTADGVFALFNNVGGHDNTAVGQGALKSNTGDNNTAVGSNALTHLTSGTGNIALGFNARSNVNAAHNVICIGIAGQDTSDSFYIGNVFETSIDPDNLPVRIDVTGRLGTQSSSRRFKDNIQPMDKASEVILALNPVTFHYKDDTRRRSEFGLIAEEVAQVDPNLVALDKEGKPYTVRYDQINAMLLNEFLKEHRKLQQLEDALAKHRNNFEATIAELKKEVESVVACSKHQDEKIQKVNARVELNKSAPRTIEKSKSSPNLKL
jgi:hypothetical protein